MARLWAIALAVALGSGVAAAQDVEVSQEVSQVEPHPITIQLGGGIEGYSRHLAPRINPGPTYGLSIAVDPIRALGFELGYTGAFYELRAGPQGITNAHPGGADLVRNGLYVILTPGYSFPLGEGAGAEVKPYLLGGMGIDRYSPRGSTASFGFSAMNVGNVPFGAGLRTRVGKFSADARFDYAWDFGNSWTTLDPNPLRYQGQLLIGAAF